MNRERAVRVSISTRPLVSESLPQLERVPGVVTSVQRTRGRLEIARRFETRCSDRPVRDKLLAAMAQHHIARADRPNLKNASLRNAPSPPAPVFRLPIEVL